MADINRIYTSWCILRWYVFTDSPMYAQFHRQYAPTFIYFVDIHHLRLSNGSRFTHVCSISQEHRLNMHQLYIICWYPPFHIPWMVAYLPMYAQFHIKTSSICTKFYIFCWHPPFKTFKWQQIHPYIINSTYTTPQYTVTYIYSVNIHHLTFPEWWSIHQRIMHINI